MQGIFPKTMLRLNEWMAQPEVLGVLLVGSKSRGYADELSDDDLEVLLIDEAHARLAPSECVEVHFDENEPLKLIYDAQYTTLTDLQRKAGSHHDLDRWPYELARVLFDRDGQVASAVEAAATMDEDFRAKRLLHATIDTMVASRRAAKTLRRGYDASGRMLVARGAKALARVLFALEWRWVPLDHWLEPELRTLEDPEKSGQCLIDALVNASPAPLEEGLARLEDRLHDEGVPRPEGRRDLFFELIHQSRADERALHGLY
jgi:hypothetical protein